MSTEIVGYVATACTTASFAPQVWKIVRSRDVKGLSLGTYSLTVTAFALWLVYGILRLQWPLIVSNGICLVLSSTILALMLLPQRKRDAVADAVAPSTG